MQEALLRKGSVTPYTIIPNKTIQSEDLTLEALGLLIYLLSKPEGWIVRAKDVQNRFGIGRDKAYRIINELIEKCYLERHEVRDEQGKFLAAEFVIFDTSDRVRVTENPLPENPHTENKDLSKERVIKNKEDIKNYNKKFEEFWKVYPYRNGTNPKKPAADKFIRHCKLGKDPDQMIEGARRYANFILQTKKDPTICQAGNDVAQSRMLE